MWEHARQAILIAAGMYAVATVVVYAAQDYLLYPGTIHSSGPALEDLPGGQHVTLETTDGLRIRSWYLPAKPGQATMLFFHGNGGIDGLKWRWQRVQSAGVGLLAITYRGYAGSEGAPSEAGLIEDGRTGYRWLRGQGVPADKIVIHGVSLGSGVAIALAGEVEAAALVLEAPYTAAVDVAALRYPLLPVHLLMRDQFLSRERLGSLKLPIIVAHGTADAVIPYAHGQEVYALVRGPKQFITLEGSDHNTLVRDGLYDRLWPILKAMIASDTAS